MNKVTLDIPLNRVEGDLEIRVSIENNRIIEARSKGTLYRGFENMLVGRVPMDSLVITPRICGICSITHLTAAVKAIEAAGNITPPPQAVRMRNLSILAETVQSDLRQVFLMFLGDFAHKYYKDYKFFDEAVEHYEPLKGKSVISALRASKDIVKVIAIIGGQWPHTSHMVPGGICTIPSLIDISMVQTHINNVAKWYEENVIGCSLDVFTETVTDAESFFSYIQENPDTHIARFSRCCEEAGLFEKGTTYPNFISYGIVDDPMAPTTSLIRPGVILDGKKLKQIDLDKITEDLSHAWYKSTEVIQQPFAGTTEPDRDKVEGYTWAKAPRYEGQPVQTGPLAQALVDEEGIISDLFSKQGDSVFVRELARLLRPVRYLQHLKQQAKDALINFKEVTYQEPAELLNGKGVGITEAARGALGHWVEVENGKISRYQIITPTAWNASPLDQKQQSGPWENALLGLEIQDMNNPMEVGHVIRSFDPCLVCTVHALGDLKDVGKWTFGVA